MGVESDGSGFESSSEQVDASLSNDSIGAGNTEIAELPEQYDFDESDVGEYIPEGELPEEDQEDSIETTEIPEMSGSGSLEGGEFDEDDFDESDVGEYDPEALNESIESSGNGIEADYEESAEPGDSAENDFDESDVGEYDPEIVEGKIDADADGDDYAEHADAGTVAIPEMSEDADFSEMDEETGSDEEDFEGASEEIRFGGENAEGAAFGGEINENTNEDFDVENADVPESADSAFEDINGSAESVDESAEDTHEDAELNEWTTEDVSDSPGSNADSPEDVDEDAEFSEEGSEGDDGDTESIEINSENAEEGSDFVEDVSEDADESAESDEESTENVGEGVGSDDKVNLEGEEDSGSDEELPEDTEPHSEVIDGTASDEENVENEEGSTEFDEESYEGEEDNTESGEEALEDVDEDSEFSDENLENAESDEEISEDEGIEFNEDAPEYIGEDTASGEEKHDNVDGDTEPDGDATGETGENVEPNAGTQESTDETVASIEKQEKRQAADKTDEKADSDRKNEGIVPDADKGRQERHSFIGAAEKERHGGVMGAAASEVAATRQEEIRQARNAETPELHRGETVSALREGHEQTIIAATEDGLEDRQPPEMFPETQAEADVENRPKRDYVDERPEEPSVDRESEKNAVADDGLDADADQDAAGQVAPAAAAGLGPGALGGATDGSGGSKGGPNGSGKLPSGPGEPGESSGDERPIEQTGARVRVEIPLMTDRQFGSVPFGEALQFGQPLSQLQRLVNEVPIPTNEMQGDAALADMIARMGVPPMRLGFSNNVVTTEDVLAFRNSRGLRWLRLGDQKSLVLVDASNKTYVQELKELAESNGTESEIGNRPEAPDIPKEEFERRLGTFSETETAAYERQKQFDIYEEGLWFEERGTMLGDYTCHGLEHIQEVMSEGERYLSALEKAGIEVPESLRRSCGLAEKYHDIGMADSVGMELARELSEKAEQPDGDFSKLAEYYNLDPDATEESTEARRKELVDAAGKDKQKVDMAEQNYKLQKFILDTKAVAEQLREMPPDAPERAETEMIYQEHISEIQDIVHSDLRNRHAYKSAEYVLSHSDEMKERYGKEVNPRNIACAIMLHSKSNSGCGDLTVQTSKAAGTEHLSVEEACSKLAADWNLNHGDQRVETTFSEADLKEIATIASVLRTADNRRNGRTATFTNGDRVLCEVSGDKVMVYHGKEVNGTVRKVRGVRSPESVKIISAESCARFSEIRPEGSNMVHVMLFDGIGSAPLEQGFATRRIVDYVGEVESGLFKSGTSEKGENGGPSAGVNIIEVHIPGASKRDCFRLEQEWRQMLANGKKQAAKQYGAAGRLRVLPAGKEESTWTIP